MTWFRIDDGFPEHPKLEVLESQPRLYMAAITVWTVMGADCARRLTDGFVSLTRLEKVLHRLGKDAKQGAQALVTCGLWEHDGDGWRYHDWADYQPKKTDVDAARRHKAARQKRWRDAHVDASTRPSVDASRDGTVEGAHARVSRPSPSQPVPTVRERARAPAVLDRQAESERVVRQEFAQRFEAAEGSLWTRAGDPSVAVLAAWLCSLPGEVDANLARTLDTFFDDPWCRSQHFPIAHLARDAHKYFEPREAPSQVKNGPQHELAALRKQHKALCERGEFGDPLTEVVRQIQQLEKDLETPRGGEPRRAFGR